MTLNYRIRTLAATIAVAGTLSCHQADKAPRSLPSASQQQTQRQIGETLWLTGNGLRLKSEIFRSRKLNDHPVLVVVLHGDSPFHNPSYQYLFASRAAKQVDDVVVAAILRPGYADDTNERSQGERGLTTGDNYTSQNVDAIAEAIDQLKTRFHPAETLLVGHSGGAAITGDILGRHPSEVDAALLVSCPCVLDKWRQHMLTLQKNAIWQQPVSSLSPLDLARKVPKSTKVWLVVGSNDDVAPPELTQEYAKALREHGNEAQVTVTPALPHDILLEPVTMEKLKELVEAMKK